jgi:hypothetical protein
MTRFNRSFLLVAAGFAAGAGTFCAVSVFALPSSNSTAYEPSHHTYLVSLDEIRSNLLWGKQFSGEFTSKVTLSDGSVREITLRPVQRDGQEMVELLDKSGHGTFQSYMGPNGTTTDGNLMINVKDVAELDAATRKLTGKEVSIQE